jgi:hypothetical protein
MKIKIEADLTLNEKETLQAIRSALQKSETLELLKAFPAGEHFNMENEAGKIVFTKL